MSKSDQKRQGGRTRTGTLEAAGTWPDGSPRFRARVRLGDGTKSERFDVRQGMTETQARAWLAGIQADEDAQGLLLAKKRERQRDAAAERGEAHEGETCTAWHDRFLTSRGEGKLADARYRWRKWIHPRIGEKPIALVTKADVEGVRDALDRAVREYRAHGRGEGRINGKTALNVWSTLTRAFKAAHMAKDATLRVREDSPCANVLPPDDTDSRQRPWLYPREVAALLALSTLPLDVRELYALAAYTYLRPNELHELRVGDVDLEGNVIHVTRAWHWIERHVKAPKTRNGVRRVPIEPALRPLLARMVDGKATDAKLVPVLERTARRTSSLMLRDHLRAAGVTRARLYADNATAMPVSFRSFRDTGITWLALAGVDVIKMQRRAGHDSVQTTLGYVKAAEDHTDGVGHPFPALPNDLVWPKHWTKREAISREKPSIVVGEQGLERGPREDASCFLGDSETPSEASTRDATRNREDADPVGPSIGPRAALAAALAEAARSAALAGDAHALRVATDALRALAPLEGGAAPIIDLASRRR